MNKDTLVIRQADDVVDAINSGRVWGGHEKAIVLIAVGFFLPFVVGTFLAQGRLTTITVPFLFNFAFGVTGGFTGVSADDSARVMRANDVWVRRVPGGTLPAGPARNPPPSRRGTPCRCVAGDFRLLPQLRSGRSGHDDGHAVIYNAPPGDRRRLWPGGAADRLDDLTAALSDLGRGSGTGVL